MLTHEQVYIMLMLRKRGNTIFSTVPLQLIKEISDFGQSPNSGIAKALRHAAYAQ